MFKWLASVLGVSRSNGSTRTVVLYRKWVFKFPRCKNLDTFFKGLAANHKERLNSHYCPNFFVPVIFSIPGLLVVMPRARPLPPNCPLVRSFMFDLFHRSRNEDPEAQHARFYCEYVTDNYGMYKGKPMCIDYGTFMPLEATRYDMKRDLDMQEWDIKRRLKSDKVDEDIQLVEEPHQICLELLDIPEPTTDVACESGKLAPELYAVGAQVQGSTLWPERSNNGKGVGGLGRDSLGTCDLAVQRHPVPNEAIEATVVLH